LKTGARIMRGKVRFRRKLSPAFGGLEREGARMIEARNGVERETTFGNQQAQLTTTGTSNVGQ